MPLVLDLNKHGLPEIAFEQYGAGQTALIYLGADTNNGLNFFVDVSLCEMPGGGRHELTFHLFTREVETGFEVQYWCGKGTKYVIPPDLRPQIATFVLMAVYRLVPRVQPERVMMTTHDPDLPEKALVKYMNILAVFDELGYKVTAPDRYHGHRLWWAELHPEPGG